MNIVLSYTHGTESAHLKAIVTEAPIPHGQRKMAELARYGFGISAVTIAPGPAVVNVRVGSRPAMHAPARLAEELSTGHLQHTTSASLRTDRRLGENMPDRWSDRLDQAATSAYNYPVS